MIAANYLNYINPNLTRIQGVFQKFEDQLLKEPKK